MRPGSTSRSIRSLATRSPKRLVIPRSSSFTALGSVRAGRVDDQVAGDDLRLQVLDLAVQLVRHLVLEVVVRRQGHTTVLQGAHVREIGRASCRERGRDGGREGGGKG